MENIGGHLELFQQLDNATRVLNHPEESLLFRVDFLDMSIESTFALNI